MVQLSALTAKLDGSLDLYADVLLNPTFPESEFKREQAIQLANIQQEQSEPFGMALRVFPPLLFGGATPTQCRIPAAEKPTPSAS